MPFNRQELYAMLAYCRPYPTKRRLEQCETCGQTWRAFCRQWLHTLPGAIVDEYANVHVRIAHADGTPARVLWSSHSDTVHWTDGTARIRLRDNGNRVLAARNRNCLGADDTAGVALMRAMIAHGTPGWYVFHAGEEVGGLGSSALRHDMPELFADIDMAIAFDRRGTQDVITHQGWSRCASDVFASALSDALNAGHSAFAYRPDDGGVYTDTAEYVDLVPECTNLSIGYQHEHTRDEVLDVVHVERLYDVLKDFDTRTLPIVRTPGEIDDWRTSPSYLSDELYKQYAFEFCEQCGLAYDVDKSGADDVDAFCSADCEAQWYVSQYEKRVNARPVDARTYLYDDVADVQQFLRKQTIRKGE